MNYRGSMLRLLCVLLFACVCAYAQTPLWVSGYYPGWVQGPNNSGVLKAEDIDYSALTHVVHFSLEPNTNGTYDSVSFSIDEVNSAALLSAAHTAGKQVLICVGGANTATGFRGATNPANRTAFVNALVSFVSRCGYDGIDIDWEPLERSDSAQFVAFVLELRAALDAISPRPLMTAAVGSVPTVFAQVQSSFDQINVMTYDMSGAYGGWVTWHNSPLYNGGFRFASTGALLPSAHDRLENFTATGIPAGKLGLGIGFYGYEWRGGTGTSTGGVTTPRQNWTVAPTVSTRAYHEIIDSFYQPAYARWDSIAQVPYLSIDNTGSVNDRFISYDDGRSSARKIEFAKAHGYGGVIIWELGSGYRANQPEGQRDGLLQAVKSAVQSANTQPTPNYPFPQHHPYTAGAITPTVVSQSGMDDAVRTFYDQWKARYLIAGCDSGEYFVFYNFEGGMTPVDATCVSEGQGYGMLITAFMAGYDTNAKIFFDGLYNYYRAHPSTINNRLMAWKQEAGCVGGLNDMDAATDGDLDIAYALLLADKQWGSSGAINYLAEANAIISAIMLDEINRDRYSVKLGDWVDSSDATYYNATRSSDFLMNHFRVFASVTGDSRWNSIINSCYNYISTIQTNNSATTGLLPDFIKNVHTTAVPAQANFLESAYDGQYYYNACRDPWRITTDYLLSGEARAKTAVQKMNAWVKTKTGSNPANLRAGYTLLGNAIHNDYVDLAFIAPFMVSAMADTSNQTWLNALWSYVVNYQLADDGYYGNSIKMLSMIVASGNWWVPEGSAIPAPSAPILSLPATGSTVNAQPVSMQWFHAENAESYHIQISSSAGFGTTVVNDSMVTDTVFSVNSLTNGSTYYWHVRAKNTGGISDWSETNNFTFVNQTRWRLVSVPMNVADARKVTLFPTAISHAYTFTGSGYVQRDSLTPGAGYWLKFGTDTTTNISGDPITADTITVTAGWNLIGSVTLPVDVSTIVTNPPNIIQGSFFGYESGYTSSSMIVPARGYWVKVLQDGVIVLMGE